MRTREKEYKLRISHYEGFRQKVQVFHDRISHLRTIFFLSSIAALISGTYFEPKSISYGLSLFLAVIFTVLIFRHARLKKRLKQLDLLLDINQEGLRRMQDQWADFPVTGEEFIAEGMSQLTDLNIFGKNSLFQMIQLTSTRPGATKLAEWISRCDDYETIPNRQEAISELSMKTSMRQHLLMEGRWLDRRLDPKAFLEWVKTPSFLIHRPALVFLQRALVFTTVSLMFLSGLGDIPPFWTIGLFLQTILFVFVGNRCREAYVQALDQDSNFLAYQKMFELVERQSFESDTLKIVQSRIFIRNRRVSTYMKRLEKINSALCLHFSIIHPFINIVFLWDIHYLYQLEKWKKAVSASIDDWFDALGEMEALSSLAGFCFDNPDYVFPKVHRDHPPLSLEEMSHPLIPANERVYNNFEVPDGGSLSLITGSNMSGKSTFVRSIGVNLILAFSGSPVAARKFITAPCQIQTCIQVVESIRQHISHFYAEVKGIKKILDAVDHYESHEDAIPVLYLIDEIFSGTNTMERLMASRGILMKLSASHSYGLVTTHDLELAGLEKESDKIRNFHFMDSIGKNGEMIFDYRIRPGPVTTTNALKILENEGIHIE